MENKTQKTFKPTICECCKQTTDYELKLDKGTAIILIAIVNAIRLKNENRIHLRNEMECKRSDFKDYYEMALAGKMTSKMIDNILRAKYHGLVAQADGGGKGEYILTSKGSKFLLGEPVIRSCIVDKASHTKKCYWNEDDKVTIGELLKTQRRFWVMPDVVMKLDEPQTQKLFK